MSCDVSSRGSDIDPRSPVPSVLPSRRARGGAGALALRLSCCWGESCLSGIDRRTEGEAKWGKTESREKRPSTPLHRMLAWSPRRGWWWYMARLIPCAVPCSGHLPLSDRPSLPDLPIYLSTYLPTYVAIAYAPCPRTRRAVLLVPGACAAVILGTSEIEPLAGVPTRFRSRGKQAGRSHHLIYSMFVWSHSVRPDLT